MGATSSHVSLLPNVPLKIRKAMRRQTLGQKLDKRKRFSRTLKRIIHYNSKHPNKDQCKLFKELVSSWTTVELSRLVEIYESMITLQQVVSMASSARCPAPNINMDLLAALEKQLCTDLVIKYQESSFPCHRAILAGRSGYFNQLIGKLKKVVKVIEVPSTFCKVDSSVFLQFIYYLYTDNHPSSSLMSSEELNLLSHKFELNRSGCQTLRHLHSSCQHADVNLVFLRTHPSNSPASHQSTDTVRVGEYMCHSVVLASRSQLLRNLIVRRMESSSNSSPLEIVLDDSAVSHKYAPIILHLIYQDELNLTLVNSRAAATAPSSLSEAQAIIAGKDNVTWLDEAMELHHIGNFLELSALTEKCENYIVKSLCPENLGAILRWSKESSGSKWVYRETLQYIQDNFMQVSQCPALFSLDEDTFTRVLQSDILQASEFDILQSVINWSEHQLIRRLEKREPNLVTNTAHSVASKGVKAKDLDDSLLREVAAPLLVHIRQSHLLSSNAEVMNNAIRRGLIPGCSVSTQRDMASSEPILNQRLTHKMRDAWVPGNKSTLEVPQIPRAYTPFYELAKSLLEERTRDMSESDVVHLRRPNRPNAGCNAMNRGCVVRHSAAQTMTRYQEELSQLPFDQTHVDNVILRTEQLLQSAIVVQALQSCMDKSAVLKQVCLWAVRELDYPDQIIYTVDRRAQSIHCRSQSADLLTNSLVPDLAPERLILHHDLSMSFENLTIHSVNSSPDVTLLSVKRKDVGISPFPDVTLHSQSGSENESSLARGAVKKKTRHAFSLPRMRKRASTLAQPTRTKAGSPESLKQHTDIACGPLKPDVLGGSPPSELKLMSDTPSIQQQSCTLDSGYRHHHRRRHHNPYHTPPRSAVRQRLHDGAACNNLLYSSLTRGLNVSHPLASAGPPPDIAQEPTRRVRGTSTPPDITASPSNTWQALL